MVLVSLDVLVSVETDVRDVAGFRVDNLRSVEVDTEEVRGPEDDGRVLLWEVRQARLLKSLSRALLINLSPHHLRIFPVDKDGVAVPAHVELQEGLAGLNIPRVGGVSGLAPVDVESDPHLPCLAGREVGLVSSVGPGVSSDLVVGGNVGQSAQTLQTRGHRAAPVALQGRLLRLIESYPELDSVSELLVANPDNWRQLMRTGRNPPLQPGVFFKPVRHWGIQPTALVLQSLDFIF